MLRLFSLKIFSVYQKDKYQTWFGLKLVQKSDLNVQDRDARGNSCKHTILTQIEFVSTGDGYDIDPVANLFG